jgi:hypothetical protein
MEYWKEVAARLKKPFPASDIEWRIGRAGKKDDKIWAMALAYVTARAVQDRLDDAVGIENWQTDIRELSDGGFLFGIGICNPEDGSWIWKWNGAQRTDIEGTKGGISGAEKRCAAAGWGIGRYLYNLTETFVKTNSAKTGDFKHYATTPKKEGGDRFYWATPTLPEWALPGGSGKAGRISPPAAGDTGSSPGPAAPGPKPETVVEIPCWAVACAHAGLPRDTLESAYSGDDELRDALRAIESAPGRPACVKIFNDNKRAGSLGDLHKWANAKMLFAIQKRLYALMEAEMREAVG